MGFWPSSPALEAFGPGPLLSSGLLHSLDHVAAASPVTYLDKAPWEGMLWQTAYLNEGKQLEDSAVLYSSEIDE